MVLSSAAASTQTTILPTARTTLSMATYQALPKSFAKMHRKYLTPTVSTLVMGGISIVLYAAFNYMSKGQVIADAVTSCGVFIATYYGLTGFTCAWYYRRNLTSSARNLWMQGILPFLGGGDAVVPRRLEPVAGLDMNSANEASYTMLHGARPALADRRRVRDRLPVLARRAARVHLHADRPARRSSASRR